MSSLMQPARTNGITNTRDSSCLRSRRPEGFPVLSGCLAEAALDEELVKKFVRVAR